MGAVGFILSICCGILVLGLSPFVIADVAPECTPAIANNSNCLTPKPGCLENSYPAVLPLPDPILQQHIVSKHNVRRALVALGAESRGLGGPQPGTGCMGELKWDVELARSAQNWADQCTLSGAPVRVKVSPQSVGGTYVGQNAYAFVDPSNTVPENYPQYGYFDKAFESWYGEVSNFKGTSAGSPFVAATPPNPVTGHYTQVVWGATTKIGCGWRRWALKDGTPRFAWIVICHYWPGGNVKGQPVYITDQVPQCTGCSTTPPILAGTTVSGSLCAAPDSAGTRPPPPSTTPGATTPGATTPGATTPGATTPGATTPGATTPGATTPVATTPGATTPVATTTGATTPVG